MFNVVFAHALIACTNANVIQSNSQRWQVLQLRRSKGVG